MIWMHCFIRPASNVGSCEDGFLLLFLKGRPGSRKKFSGLLRRAVISGSKHRKSIRFWENVYPMILEKNLTLE